jgi:hypothetical protein
MNKIGRASRNQASDYEAAFRRLRRRIFLGAKPHENRTARFARLLRDIRQMRASSGPASQVLEIFANQFYGTISTDDTILQLRPIAGDLQTPAFVRIAAYARCSALAYKNACCPGDLHVSFREKALQLAKENGLVYEAFVILANWLFAATYADDLPTSERIVRDIESLGSIPGGNTKEERADFIEWNARYKTHLAKYLLLKAKAISRVDRDGLIKEAGDLYQAAIDAEPAEDHRRVNKQIEWANRLIDLGESVWEADFVQIEGILEFAHRSLDSHGCDLCRAFYFETAGGMAELQGDILLNTDRQGALRYWESSIERRRESVRLYSLARHHFAKVTQEASEKVEEKLKTETLPQKIFLSHKGVDKELVRRFYHVLEELGFQPWLDEKALTAGTRLHRDIQRGFKESCAGVFFVTKAFKDEKYIAAEIDYANTEYIERPEGQFAVITIAFEDSVVPESLRRWVYKNCDSELQALLEILRALPVQTGSVHSRKTTVGPKI